MAVFSELGPHGLLLTRHEARPVQPSWGDTAAVVSDFIAKAGMGDPQNPPEAVLRFLQDPLSSAIKEESS